MKAYSQSFLLRSKAALHTTTHTFFSHATSSLCPLLYPFRVLHQVYFIRGTVKLRLEVSKEASLILVCVIILITCFLQKLSLRAENACNNVFRPSHALSLFVNALIAFGSGERGGERGAQYNII